MPIRIPWNQHEVALLIDAYLHITDGADLGQTATQLSLTLRDLALRAGTVIDDTYRNVNGMKMQLGDVQYLFTDGKKGLSGASSMIQKMFEVYKKQPDEFQRILREAIQLTGQPMSVEDAFFAYAKNKTGLSPKMLADCLKKAADYCHLKQPLLGLTDVKAVRNAQQKVAEEKLLRFRYGKDAQTIRNVTHLYYTFVKSYHEKPVQPVEEATQPLQPAEQTAQGTRPPRLAEFDPVAPLIEPAVVEEPSLDTPTAPVTEYVLHTPVPIYEVPSTDDTEQIDFAQDNTYLFTKPVSYTYRGDRHEAKSWNRLYVEICGLLFVDYRDQFMEIMNGDIPGYNALAFADELNYRQMREPKSFAPGYYLESNLDATSIVRKLRGLYRLFDLDDRLQITYRKVEGYQPTTPSSRREMEKCTDLTIDNDFDWNDSGLSLVSFTHNQSYAFTQPEAYDYKGTTRRVNKWGKLYEGLCGLLFTDYSDQFMTIMNGDIPGYNTLAFADEDHKNGMRVARCFTPGYYLESNIDATTIVRRINGLYRLLNLGGLLRIAYRSTKEIPTEKPDKPQEEWFIHELRTRKISYVDNRSAGGCLWIASDMSISIPLNEAAERGYQLRFKSDGCRAFPDRPVLWTKDQPKVSLSEKFDTSAFRKKLEGGFRHFLISDRHLSAGTVSQYCQSIEAVEQFIHAHQLDWTLDTTDESEAQHIYNALMQRKNFVDWNNQRHHQYSAALAQYVLFLRQGESDVPEDTGKQPGQKTIIETVFDVIRQAGRPMTVAEIYRAITKDNLYPFGAQDPQSVVYSKVSLACRRTDDWIKEGRDVLICSEVDGRKVFQAMSAKEAAAYLQIQQRKAELENASPWVEYEAVLKWAFPKGFQKESGLDMKKLRKRWAEIHGEELKDSDDTVRLQLAAHCVDTRKRWYLAELLLSDDDRQKVLQYIDRVLSSGKSVLYYSSIYAALEHQLESTVLTEDLLVSYLQATCQDRYILREHYLTNDRHAQVELSEEIKDVMLAHGRPIHTDELKRALHHLPPDQVERELHIHSEFIMDAFHMYFHESMVNLTDQELDRITEFIQDELDDQGYMIGDWIQRKLTRLYPETAERLSFLTLLGVRGAVAYKLRDRFTFSGPVITPKGKVLNMIDIFAMFCQRHAPFTLEQLSAFAKECDSTIYWNTVHENCARVSETDFVPTGSVRWDIPHVDAAILLHCPGKYVSLKSIQYFDAFPFVGYQWNSYLLEQYVATVSKDFTLMHSSYAKNNTSGAIVRQDAGFETFDEVLAVILASAPVDLEKDPCLGFLADEGYITRRKLSNINEIISRAKMLRSQKG